MAAVDPVHEQRVKDAMARVDEAYKRRWDDPATFKEAVDELHRTVSEWADARNAQEAGK